MYPDYENEYLMNWKVDEQTNAWTMVSGRLLASFYKVFEGACVATFHVVQKDRQSPEGATLTAQPSSYPGGWCVRLVSIRGFGWLSLTPPV